ncbi:hypothetical protein [Arachnia propionica]|uniref:VWFA domain-containing protein n=1 Tax=Arachnia propionica TaxID=1750 RepID=A0A3P1WP88_9ACTN|nr:hypothetical protein [Arachnia propionica]RRD47627.1 hypothetical protein EII35_14775 [Arachnia propionica]
MRRLVALLATALGLVLITPAPTATADEPDPISPATTHLYSCLQTAHSVSVLFVLDKSGSLSLPDKDPEGLRYDGLTTALTGLSGIHRSDGERIDVEAAIAGFSDSYLPAAEVAPWQRINGDDHATVIAQMVERARTRLTPQGGTDFQQALEGGHADFDLAHRSSDCRIMFWFTDGEFTTAKGKDLVDDGEAVAGPLIEQARAEMCAPTTGVIDRLRAAGVVVLGIQLGPAAADLKRMSIGILDDTTCGTWPIPDGWAPGGYLQVDDAANLNWVFSRMNDLATGCTPTPGNHIDAGIGRMMVRIPRAAVVTPVPETETVTLTAPDGQPLTFTVPGEHNIGAYRVETSHDAGQLGVRVTLPAETTPGAWQVTEPADQGTPTFCVWSDLTLTPDPDQPPLTATESGRIRAVATRPDGSVADLGVYRDVTLTARVTTAHGDVLEAPARIDGGSVVIDVTPGELDPRLDVAVTATPTTGSGLVLAPVTAAWSVPVRSDSFPSILPTDRLDLGTIIRTDTGRATLTLTGAKLGPSSVCLASGGEFTGPVADESSRLDLPEGCIDLQPGEQRTVEVSFTPGQQAVGAGRSSLTVTLTSAASAGQEAQDVTFQLPVTWYQTVPVNLATFTLTFLLLTAASVLLMGAAVWLAMFLTTKFTTKGLRHTQADIRITPTGFDLIQPSDAAPERPHSSRPGSRRSTTRDQLFDDLRPLIPLNPRIIKVPGVTLRAYTPLFPGQSPRFTAYVPDTHLIESNSSEVGLDGGHRVPVTPGLAMLVLVTASIADVVASPPGGPLRATLHIITTNTRLTPQDMSRAVQGLRYSSYLESWQKTHRPHHDTTDTPSTTQRNRPFTRRRPQGE